MQHQMADIDAQVKHALDVFTSDAIDNETVGDNAGEIAAMADVYALEAFRNELRRIEQLLLDEAIAISISDAEAAALLRDAGDSTSDNDFVLEAAAVDNEAKPPPSCACCLLELEDATTRRMLPCGHLYCLACIRTRAGMSVRDRTLLPAHCCRKEFPIEYIVEALTQDDFALYERFLSEKHWTAVDLDSDREYARTAKEHGCVQCPGCGVGVSRISGCNRMRCCHGHEFCFDCGKVWKTCGCAYP